MKVRLDQLMLTRNLAESREKAKAMILANNVLVNNVPALKAGELVPLDCEIKLRGLEMKYVSRAGDKLDKALIAFKIDVTNLVCLDIGSSTGGFTDCLLQHNAKLVYAVDVGTNQLVWKLRQHAQVISLEKTNFRYATPSLFSQPIEFACCDVSFISLDKILPPLKDILQPNHFAVVLIKPQFETTIEKVNQGKISDPTVHFETITKIINLALANDFSVLQLDYSPILGNKKANIEFIALLQRTANPVNHISNKMIENVINTAWKKLK
ncbi:rRNA methyltransferase [Spiroplasma syrphidicola EA-1]|uniref:rRNA methyltransferase n=1 Tax=Spiroplasma syrphidicola EA-1 TaxID=1276229 RepID=R4U681_9MOLU|nr:TlyA family RNA methyltransferase [Spiroplasma syrphidicola]AGM26113.1 rRNA methyltransferase [Spiroplasma syrphidicola EA-1]